MQKKNHYRKNIQPTIIAIFVFSLLTIATISYTKYKQGQWEKDIRVQLTDILIGKKSKLEKALYSRIYYTRGVAAYVALNPEISNTEYNELAKEYIRNDSVINSMALSKNGIINAIYPIEGHEAAIGLNLLEHPERKEIVEKTIEMHLTFIAGPVELVEGGLAFISYTPIFDKTKEDNPFWGVTDIVIKKNSLFNEANLKQIENDFIYALRGYNGLGENGDIFWGRNEVFDQEPVTIEINLPIGNWILAVAPAKGWKQFQDQDKTLSYLLFVSTFIISVLIWLFTNALVKIKQNEKELKAIFASLDSIIIELDQNGKYVKVASENERLLVIPKEKILGKRLHEVFDKQQADFFHNAILECIKTEKLVVIDYPLTIDGQKHWFTARISYKSPNSVIFNAYDITDKKQRQELLEKSEKELKDLNEMKDKFFSVIAHDLRSPVASQKALADIIIEEYHEMDDSDRKDMLMHIKESSENLHRLLDNLLDWAKSQSGKIIVQPTSLHINEEFDTLISEFKTLATQKNINLINNIPDETVAIADKQMTRTILRNLISNAIKFTNEGGEVSISSGLYSVNGEQYLQINITDNGIGISETKLNSLFKPDEADTTSGTANEKGTGLGLLLCKEFAELQGGQIMVKSEINKGSTFSFTLPTYWVTQFSLS